MRVPSAESPAPVRDVAPLLLEWYHRHARDLPWRAPPGTPAMDPYRVWLSEIMLQQTTVAAVKSYFQRFTALWPDVQALAAAPEAEYAAALEAALRLATLIAARGTGLGRDFSRRPST